jgi:drug/metabolite transporter (DMT)-like permease
VHRVLIVLAAVLFSTGGAAIKSCGLDGWQIASFRSGIAALAIALLLPSARRGWNWRILLVGCAYAGTMILFVMGNKLTTAANTIFLQSSAPLYLLLLAPLLLHERIARRELVAMAVIAVGLVLFFVEPEAPASTAPDPFRGNLCAVGSGLFWGLTLLGLRWIGTSATGAGSALAPVVVGNALACLVVLPLALPVQGATTLDWGLVLYLGLFQIGVAYFCLTSGIRKVGAFEASLLLLAEPALNPVWALLVHGERPGPWAIAGGLLILGATVAITAAKRAPTPVAVRSPDDS